MGCRWMSKINTEWQWIRLKQINFLFVKLTIVGLLQSISRGSSTALLPVLEWIQYWIQWCLRCCDCERTCMIRADRRSLPNRRYKSAAQYAHTKSLRLRTHRWHRHKLRECHQLRPMGHPNRVVNHAIVFWSWISFGCDEAELDCGLSSKGVWRSVFCLPPLWIRVVWKVLTD